MLEITTDEAREARKRDLEAEDRDLAARAERERRGNSQFVQVYPKGWARLQMLMRDQPAAARIFAFLCEHVDGTVNAVTVSQDVMADALGVHVRTIKRHTKTLEDCGALIRLRVGTGVYAYCLDPEEVYRAWNCRKSEAAFITKTLVRKADRANGEVRRKLKVMLGQPELPGLDEG